MIPDGNPGKRRYGNWAGNPKGHPEDISCCIQSVYGTGRFVADQCSRKRVTGPNGEFCKQHASKLTSKERNILGEGMTK